MPNIICCACAVQPTFAIGTPPCGNVLQQGIPTNARSGYCLNLFHRQSSSSGTVTAGVLHPAVASFGAYHTAVNSGSESLSVLSKCFE